MNNTQGDISERVLQRFFGQKKPGEIPLIMCRRTEPVKFTYDQHDTTWEGLIPTM